MKERSWEVLQRFRRVITAREAITFGIAAALFIFFTSMSEGTFASPKVISIMAVRFSEMGIIVLGEALLLICGEFDLSVGSVSAVGAYIAVFLYGLGLNPFLATAMAVGGGMGVGAMNGLVTVKFGVPSFIVTLGSMLMWRGVLGVLTEGHTLTFYVRETHPAFYNLLRADFGVVSAPLIWFVVITIMLVLLLNFHRFGNHIFATGGNKEAARAMGININKTKVICFMIISGLCAFSGVMQATRIRGFQAMHGSGIEFMVFAAVVIGGTSLFGGIGTVAGAFLGVIITTFLEFGLIMVKVPGFWYKAVLGIVIIVVASVNEALERRRK